MNYKNVVLILVILFMFGLLAYQLMSIEESFRDSVLTEFEKCDRRCSAESRVSYLVEGVCYCKDMISFDKNYRCLSNVTFENAEKYSTRFNTSFVRNVAVSSAIQYENPNSIPTRLFSIYQAIGERVHYISDPRDDEYIATPAETWNIQGGDCDDISILMASMFESIGLDASMVEAYNESYGHVFVIVRIDEDLDRFLQDYKPLIEKYTPYFGMKPFNFLIFRETESECEYSLHNLYMGESVKPFYVIAESTAQGYPGKNNPFEGFNNTRFINIGQ
ncbi:MAG: transglutaminase domain-containing protein [Candidatus Aenigmarchaeota archaeon]|nr:transglutaminase domain-containing protein [Candidatus Aenigmarchaeota archaeon]